MSAFTLRPACFWSHPCRFSTQELQKGGLTPLPAPCICRGAAADLLCQPPLNLHPSLSTGAVGEAGERGGDPSDEVLRPVEEAEGEGDPAGDHRQRKSKKHLTNAPWQGEGALSWQHGGGW